MPTEAGTPADKLSHAYPSPPVPDALNVIDEDADKCCRSNIPASQIAKLTGFAHAGWVWVCADCGTQFAVEMVGPNRYWSIVPSVAIVRPRR